MRDAAAAPTSASRRGADHAHGDHAPAAGPAPVDDAEAAPGQAGVDAEHAHETPSVVRTPVRDATLHSAAGVAARHARSPRCGVARQGLDRSGGCPHTDALAGFGRGAWMKVASPSPVHRSLGSSSGTAPGCRGAGSATAHLSLGSGSGKAPGCRGASSATGPPVARTRLGQGARMTVAGQRPRNPSCGAIDASSSRYQWSGLFGASSPIRPTAVRPSGSGCLATASTCAQPLDSYACSDMMRYVDQHPAHPDRRPPRRDRRDRCRPGAAGTADGAR